MASQNADNVTIAGGTANLLGATVSAQNGAQSGFTVQDAGLNKVFSVGDGSALIKALWGFDSSNYVRGNYFSINRAASNLKSLDFQSVLSTRWRITTIDDASGANFFLQSYDLSGNFLANRMSFDRASGFTAIGAPAPTTPSALFQVDGAASASVCKYSNTATGATATDGFDVGIESNGAASLRQRENLSLDFYTNNTLRMSLSAAGNLGLANGIGIGGGNTLNRAQATFSGSLPAQTINAGQTVTISGIAVTGAVAGNSDIGIVGGYSANLPDGILARAFSSGTNLMDAKFTNVTASAIVIAAAIQFRIGYLKF
jgi:hypothetical protein